MKLLTAKIADDKLTPEVIAQVAAISEEFSISTTAVAHHRRRKRALPAAQYETRRAERMAKPTPGSLKEQCYAAFERLGVHGHESVSALATAASSSVSGVKFSTLRAYASSWMASKGR